jgi:siroheme synthase-like protein
MTMSNSFYPLVLALKDVPVLVCGAGDKAFREIVRLTEAGASVTIVAPAHGDTSAMDQLVLTYGSRAVWHRVSADAFLLSADCQLDQFAFALLLAEGADRDAESNANNLNALMAALAQNKVRFYLNNRPEQSDFVLSSFLKRGHLKISVSTDGLCQPLERAITRRIEEIFVSDFDQYSLFLASFEEKTSAVKAASEANWLELYRRLEHENSHVENFHQALSRKNFEEALRIVDNHIANIKAGRSADASESVGDTGSDILPPRQAVKGVS